MSDKTSVLRGPKVTVTKTRAWARTQTTGTQVATLPKGARLMGFTLGGVASDAGTTATISIGTTSANSNEWVSGADVKTAAAGRGPTGLPMQSGIYGTILTADTPVFFKYAETGVASTVGGGFISLHYTTDNLINNDAI